MAIVAQNNVLEVLDKVRRKSSANVATNGPFSRGCASSFLSFEKKEMKGNIFPGYYLRYD